MADFIAPPIDRTWAAIESRLDRNPFGDDFNTAHEACTRYANDPGRLALTIRHDDGSADRWTYQQLDRQAAKAARVFARAGLRPGDRVAGLLSTGRELDHRSRGLAIGIGVCATLRWFRG